MLFEANKVYDFLKQRLFIPARNNRFANWTTYSFWLLYPYEISVPTYLPDGFVHHCFINYPASVTLIFKSSCCLIQKTIPSALSVAGQWIKHLLDLPEFKAQRIIFF